MRGVYSQAHPSRASPVPSQKFFKKSQTFFQKPLDKTYLLCYTISVNRRGHDHLPLKLSLKVCSLSPMVFLSHRSLSKGLFAHFTSFLWYRVGGAPDYRSDFHGDFLSDDGERPVTARKMWLTMWKEHTHISWRDSSMTVEKTLAARKQTSILSIQLVLDGLRMRFKAYTRFSTNRGWTSRQ